MEIRRFTQDDIAAMLRLCRAAGWNQTERDVGRMLALEPDGCFAACEGGQVLGTATTTTYGTALGWIGMMLVDPEFRCRGIASMLMEAALAYLWQRGVTTIKLDATPDGRPVYERFGFEPECRIERWEGRATTWTEARVERASWDQIAAYDLAVFGVDRGALLKALVADAGWPVVLNGDCEGMLGYAFARPGFRANYVGPVVAGDLDTARTLLTVTLSRLDGPAFVDVNTEFSGATNLVRELGFTRQRELLRMRLGPDSRVSLSPRVFAIAGPEVG